jgi:hypothetical protein
MNDPTMRLSKPCAFAPLILSCLLNLTTSSSQAIIMTLSAEAIISIVSVAVATPPALLVAVTLLQRRLPHGSSASLEEGNSLSVSSTNTTIHPMSTPPACPEFPDPPIQPGALAPTDRKPEQRNLEYQLQDMDPVE